MAVLRLASTAGAVAATRQELAELARLVQALDRKLGGWKSEVKVEVLEDLRKPFFHSFRPVFAGFPMNFLHFPLIFDGFPMVSARFGPDLSWLGGVGAWHGRVGAPEA